MINNKVLLNEYAMLAGKEDAISEARKQEILDLIKKHADNHDRLEAQDFLNEKVMLLEKEVVALRSQMEEEIYKLLPLRYIAQKYFGKSAAWLSQRLNGTEVHGHIYSLNAEQKCIFNRAVQEIGQTIGSIRLA